jgi:hypothetical protein
MEFDPIIAAMKKVIIPLVILTAILLLLEFSFTPVWWFDLCAAILFGILFPFREKTPVFLVGLFAGIITWGFGVAHAYMTLDAGGMQSVANLLGGSVELVFVICALLGGLITGLAVVVGYQMFRVGVQKYSLGETLD